MKSHHRLVIASAVVLLALDAAWIGSNIQRYSSWLSRVELSKRVDLVAAASSYIVLFLVGFLGLALPMIKAQLDKGRRDAWWLALRWSGAVGFVSYATFNLVNKALFANYPWSMVFVDTAWGTTLYTLLGWLAASSLLRR